MNDCLQEVLLGLKNMLVPASEFGGQGSILGQPMWVSWSGEWHWDRFFEYFVCFLLV